MSTPAELLDAVLASLAPNTRVLHTYPDGTQHTTLVTDQGVDVHVGRVGQAATFPGTDTIRPYLVLWAGPGQTTGNRLAGRPHGLVWSLPVTCVGADTDTCLWALAHTRAALDGVRLTADAGLLRQTSDPGNLRVDDDVRPPRTYVPLTFATRAHGASPNP